MWDAGSTGRDGSSAEWLEREDALVLLLNHTRADLVFLSVLAAKKSKVYR